MSTKYTGGFITKSPVAPTSSAASGIWTLDQQQQAQKAGTWPSPPIFIEDMFSTYLYTGAGANQTITNGIDLSGQGGLVWIKDRSSGSFTHRLYDTARGVAGGSLESSTPNAQNTFPGVTAFSSTGFTLNGSNAYVTASGDNFVSWTFRKAPKFFDVVTYTGTGVARTVAHSLGSVPGCMIVKNTSTSADWQVYHQSTAGGMGPSKYMVLNSTAAESSGSDRWNNTAPTSTVFTVGNAPETNDSGATYVAYLFAHDAGGFPVSGGGSTNGISCGSFTTDGSGAATVSLGYEPQWLLWKRSDSTSNWLLLDNMRSWNVGGNDFLLRPNSSDAESTGANYGFPTATGFYMENMVASATYIYIAIRRGPMKTPTVGTSVFSPVAQSTSGSYPRPVVTNFPVDFVIMGDRSSVWGYNWSVQDRLRGNPNVLFTSATSAENTGALSSFAYNTQFGDGWVTGSTNGIYECMRRAPGFMDVVCFTTPSSGTITVTHNLGVTPQLVITKLRSGTSQFWIVNSDVIGATNYLVLNQTDASASAGSLAYTPSSTTVTFDAGYLTASSPYVQYLFATLAGVSKVGSYTGTGALQTVNCGFTSGARFVLIKRTDSTGGWYTYDSARGITSGNDPYLLMNSTAAEVTGTNYVDTDTTGFKVTAAAPAELNANGGTFIFLAIA